ncbi:MAG: 16S rRNA processing protein RimM [Actinomycetia bacterium]|nr:16S rRNA processing protein RimM [Actinomycetes bacterium]
MTPKSHLIGNITRVKGINGDVTVKLLTDFPKNLKRNTVLYLQENLSEENKLSIEKIVLSGDIAKIKFVNINNRDRAKELIGSFLYKKSCKSPKLSTNSYWAYQIIGLKVYDEDDNNLGVVEEIWRTKTNDIYVVRSKNEVDNKDTVVNKVELKSRDFTHKKKEYLIPAVKDIVKEVDLKNKKMIVKMIPGMEDI